MNINQYKIGELVIELKSPFKINSKKPFSDYLCENEKADYTVNFEVVNSIECDITKAVYKARKYILIKDGNKNYFYYQDDDKGRSGYYACRITQDGSKECKILVKPYFTEIFYDAVIFETIGMEEIFAQNLRAIFHSSYLNVNGEAILFTGPCEIGKSTQADLWAKYRNAEIVNGDKSLIYVKDGVPTAGGLPFSGSSSFCVKKDLPIKAIVILSKRKENSAQMLNGMNAFLAVYKSCYPVAFSKELTNNQMNLAQNISAAANIYEFGCLPDESAVEYLERFINGK